MANKLSFSVSFTVLLDNLNKMANSVKTVFKGMQTEVGKFLNSLGNIVQEWDTVAMEMLTSKKANEAKLTAATAQRVTAEKALEEARLQHSIATGSRKLAAAEEVTYREIMLSKAILAEENAVLAVQMSNSAARIGVGTRAMNALKVGAGKLMVSLKTMWASFAPGLVISAIMAVVSHFKNLKDEANRIKNIFSDYKKEIDNIGTSIEGIRLQSLLNVASNLKFTAEERNAAWQELARQMDITRKKGETELEYQERINDAVKKRQELIVEQNKIDLLAQKKAEAADNLRSFRKKLNIEGMREDLLDEMLQKFAESNKASYPASQLPLQKGVNLYFDYIRSNGLQYTKGYEDIIKEMVPFWQIYKDASNQLETAMNEALKLQSKSTISNLLSDIPENDESKDTEDIIENHSLQLNGGTTTYEPLSRDQELQQIQTNYTTELSKLDNQLEAGSISQKKYNAELQNLINNTISLAASLLGGDAAANEFFSGLLEKRMDIALPERQKRDTTFDYRKTNLDISREELDIAEKYLNDFKTAVDEGARYTQEQLNAAMGKVTSLRDAIRIAEVKEDIKNLQRELGEGFYSGMKNMVSDADRIGNAFSNMRDVLSNVDASGWERIMAVWNAFSASMDAYFSIIKVVEQLTEVTKQLSRAKQIEAAIDSQVTGQKVANASVEIAADLTAAGVKKSTATQELAADTAAAAGSAGKSAAGLPFPFNLIAVAAAIGGVIALFASIPKFAYGGIVGGSSFAGDRILARLNSGEMVLNQRQQSRLFGMLNSGGSATRNQESEKVEFRIEGTTLMGVLNNTNKRLSKFK